jgi:hypothetical protein
MSDGHGEKQEGTMIRVARWLLSEVGEGNVFTKQDLRAAFPNVEQVDRRMRALRDFDWIINTNLEDASLSPHELRFASQGQAVWDKGRSSSGAGLSSKARRHALSSANYLCQTCGIPAGVDHPDPPLASAVLSVTRNGDEASVHCQRCRSGGNGLSDKERAWLNQSIEALSVEEVALLKERLSGSWAPTGLDRIWGSAIRHERYALETLEGFSRANSDEKGKEVVSDVDGG